MTDITHNKYNQKSDSALIRQIGAYIKHHRIELNKTQEQLANEAGISRSTLSLLENGDNGTIATLLQVLRVLDKLFIMDGFEIHESISPLSLLKLQKEKRQRAGRRSGKKDKPSEELDW
ncbi:helix-turn-helix domain-containing protein [Belliella marina]|uniref:Helix-turn-helix domain-containing protein n=1 Tax=Belliella marina TaxID=1644146 RepID=A0ABW4VL64_9BACT